nr:hypothetical protein SEVIR_9G047400v2 [Setaria viridis]
MDVSLTSHQDFTPPFEPFNSFDICPLSARHTSVVIYPEQHSSETPISAAIHTSSLVHRHQARTVCSGAMSKPSSSASLLLLLLSAATLAATCLADPEPVQDFCVAAQRGSDATASLAFPGLPCKPASTVVSDDFFFAAHARAASTDNPAGAGVTPGNVEAFPGLNTLGLSLNRVDLAPGGVNPLHTHPRAAELVHVEEGEMLVGFVSTDGRFYSKVVRAGESFVIPRGMMHFQYNVGAAAARAMTVFNSQLPGVVLAAQSLFGAEPEVPDAVLAKSFQVDAEIIKLLKSKFRKG